MKKHLILLLFSVTASFAQPTAKLDTLSVICGLKLDDAVLSNRYEKFKPERCDTCKSYHMKENLVYLKSPSVFCYGTNPKPFVRQFDMGIYQIVLPVNINDSALTNTYVKFYGKFQQTDTVASGTTYKRLTWKSPNRRLELLKNSLQAMVVLTSATVQNEFMAEYIERELSAKRDNEAKKQIENLSKTGTGKNSFIFSLAYIEGLIKSCNANSLTNTLGQWSLNTDPFETQVSWSHNVKTNRRDLCTYQLHYISTVKERPMKFWLKVPATISEFAYSLKVSAEMNGNDYAVLKQSLRNGGYLLNEPLTVSLRKETWENKTKQYTISLSYSNGTAYIEILNITRFNKSFPKK